MAHMHQPQIGKAPPHAAGRTAAVRVTWVALALLAGALLAAAGLLWQRHGASVFFDILNAGIASCL